MNKQSETVTLNHALTQFELAEANLARLEVLWEKIEGELPNGPAFGAPPKYDEWCIAFKGILAKLPAVDGYRVEDRLYDYDEAGQMWLDAMELGEFEVQVSVSRELAEQGRQLREYPRLLHKSWHVVVTQAPAFSVARAWRSSPSSLSLLFIDRIALPAGRMMRPAR